MAIKLTPKSFLLLPLPLPLLPPKSVGRSKVGCPLRVVVAVAVVVCYTHFAAPLLIAVAGATNEQTTVAAAAAATSRQAGEGTNKRAGRIIRG